ncbi:putative acyl--CoA ligase YdaB [Episyrphus balteatus]|uniref:putative acyl--CoA ligase YdaB n=1 Tax=Episyrphus balteatus TaxID=286459 RepID=UPI00248692F2|nr:putative acyl--CoA ligase YdaB [Episyrphus balteatus]
MNNIEYVESEKFWRAPKLDVKPVCLGEAILEILNERDPEQVYEVHHDSGSQVTNKDIRERTITAAQNLLNLGVKKGDVVVVFSFLNLKITPLTYACYTIGAPVCFFETYLEEEYVPEYLEKLDPTVIIYEEKFKSMVFKGLKGLSLPKLKHTLSLNGREQNSIDDLIFKPPVDIENFQIPNIGHPDDTPAILGFTSGSTGLPKIVIHSHSLIKQSAYGRWQAKPGSVVMVLSEIRWNCQVSCMLQPAFLNVKRIYSSIPQKELTGEFVREIIDTHKVTHYFEVPAFYINVIESAEQSQDPSSLSSLKLVLLGGESIGEATLANIAKITPNCEIGRNYGMTEVGGNIVSTELASRKNVNGGVLRKDGMVKIIDRNNQPLGPNQLGRVCLKTRAKFFGYLKNEKANKETFIEDGWINSGDLGMVDSDNLLIISAREKFVLHYADGSILIPSVIENIVNSFEGIHSSALVGQPSKENPKEDVGTIFVVFKNFTHSIYLENDLKEYLRKKLTHQQLQIVKYFKVLEDLPKTSCLKVNRIALKEMVDGEHRKPFLSTLADNDDDDDDDEDLDDNGQQQALCSDSKRPSTLLFWFMTLMTLYGCP